MGVAIGRPPVEDQLQEHDEVEVREDDVDRLEAANH
jgi:hypothetical protein